MFFDLIEKRRSKRIFNPVRIEKEKVDKLIEAALRSPSSRGFNPWRFIVVDDPGLLEKISRAKPHGSSFLKGAPLGIVVLADPEISDVWVEDTSIATIFIQLAAEDMGLGSCWIQIRKRDHSDSLSAENYIKKLLNIPSGLTVESVIALGYSNEKKRPHSRESLQMEKIFFNRFE